MSEAISLALGKAVADLEAAMRDAQRSGLPFLKPKLEAVARLQAAFNRQVAAAVVVLTEEVERLKGGAHGQ